MVRLAAWRTLNDGWHGWPMSELHAWARRDRGERWKDKHADRPED
jgi:hypothetical protein